MDGVSLIEGQTLKHWEERLANIEQNQLALIKLIKEVAQPSQKSAIPDFITIEDAAKKYNTSKTTIYNKIKLFVKKVGREIDRLQMGTHNLVNEVELLQALRIKTPIPEIFEQKMRDRKRGFKK